MSQAVQAPPQTSVASSAWDLGASLPAGVRIDRIFKWPAGGGTENLLLTVVSVASATTFDVPMDGSASQSGIVDWADAVTDLAESVEALALQTFVGGRIEATRTIDNSDAVDGEVLRLRLVVCGLDRKHFREAREALDVRLSELSDDPAFERLRLTITRRD